jgi:glyoxylase-like metal-dependent hydrolase (beta-lactamase superfamily II)
MKDKYIDCVVVGDIETNCWLYRMEDESDGHKPCAVIDPGDEAGKIILLLKKLDWVPRFVFLTHGHFDHIMALPELLETGKKGSFGSAPVSKIGIHRLDAHYLGKGAFSAHRNSVSAAGANPAEVISLWKPMPEADILFEEGDSAGPFKVLHIPGHTQGSIALYDEKTGVLFSGDILFKGDWVRTDLPGGNEDQIQQSLIRLLAMDENIAVYPGHGPVTSIREERQKFYS